MLYFHTDPHMRIFDIKIRIRYKIFTLFLLVLINLFGGAFSEIRVAEALPTFTNGSATITYPKYAYSNVSKAPPPNVLFLLDVGGQMAFTTDGVMPLATDSNSVTKRKEMMRECTYGAGVRPFYNIGRYQVTYHNSYGSSFTVEPYEYVTYDQYGRDLDSTNNIGVVDSSLLPYCYYDPENTGSRTRDLYTLTYKNQTDASGGLVPNDSRMYKLKLILWRLLYPRTDPAIKSHVFKYSLLFSNVRIGVATTFSELFYPYWYDFAPGKRKFFDIYKDFPIYSSVGKTSPYGISSSFPNGSGLNWLGLGTNDTTDSIPNPIGINSKLYDGYQAGSKNWLWLNRSILHIPFGTFQGSNFQVSNDGNHLECLLEYLNGFESTESYSNLLNIKPDNEFLPAGRSNIATSLYARDYHTSKKAYFSYTAYDSAFNSITSCIFYQKVIHPITGNDKVATLKDHELKNTYGAIVGIAEHPNYPYSRSTNTAHRIESRNDWGFSAKNIPPAFAYQIESSWYTLVLQL